MSETKKHLAPSETNEFVLNCASKAQFLIFEECKDLDPKQQWLIHARIINVLFASFFQPMIAKANNELNKSGDL